MKLPTYRRHSSRDFGFVETQGERIRLPGRYNSSESRAAYLDLCAKIERGSVDVVPLTDSEIAKMTVEDVGLRYLSHIEERAGGRLKRGDYANNRDAVHALIKHYGSTLAAKFTPKMLKTFQKRLAETRKKAPKSAGEGAVGDFLSRKYVNAQVSRIKTMFKWAVAEEFVGGSVHLALTAVSGLRKGRSSARETGKRKPVPLRYVKPILPHVPKVIRAMLCVQVLTGARSRSICQAKPEQFERQGELWIWRPRHKTENNDVELQLPIGPKCQKILARWLKDKKPDEFLFSPRSVRNDRRYRKHYDAQSYCVAVKRGIVKANRTRPSADQIPEWTPHLIRHFKGDTVNEVYGIEAAQAVLGHDSINATKVYTSRRLSLAKKVAKETG